MSLIQVRTALQTQLATISPALATAYENEPYTPVAGTPYQQVTILRAQPDNLEIGPIYTDRGILQVNLFYPLNAGAGAAEARAELIRTAFAYGSSFVSGGVTVTIIATPEVAPARAEDDRFLVPVRIRFSAFIGG